MSDVERQHLGPQHADALLRELRQAEHDLGSEQFAYADELEAYELLAAMIVLMVCAVTLYGHWLGKVFQRRRYDELQETSAVARAAGGTPALRRTARGGSRARQQA